MIRTALILVLLASFASFAQTETLRNSDVIDMSSSGLSKSVILKKISSSKTEFELSAKALVELKSAGVADEIIEFMMETRNIRPIVEPAAPVESKEVVSTAASFSSSVSSESAAAISSRPRSISFEKSSLQPSVQALEKELLKRGDFRALNLTIQRYKDQSDLYVEIGFVSGSWITHRYVYRIYDRRSAVIAAGETTSWGSLAENLARHISKRLSVAMGTYAGK